jgi:hypothetical protein
MVIILTGLEKAVGFYSMKPSVQKILLSSRNFSHEFPLTFSLKCGILYNRRAFKMVPVNHHFAAFSCGERLFWSFPYICRAIPANGNSPLRAVFLRGYHDHLKSVGNETEIIGRIKAVCRDSKRENVA